MRNKLVPLLILFSVGLNAAFVGAWAVSAVASHWPHASQTQPVADAGEPWSPLHRRLGVTAEQWRRLEPRVSSFCKTARLICQEVNRKRREMIDIIAAEPTDRQAIAAKQEEILAGQRRMQRLVIDRLLAEKEVMTPDQQEQLFDLIRQRGQCVGRGPLMRLLGEGADDRSPAGTRPTGNPEGAGRGSQEEPGR